MTKAQCPCGSGGSYKACCGRLISGGAQPETAEQLMRSRYSAYVLSEEAYLLETWHSSTRPAKLHLSESPQWRGLKIVHSTESTVEFIARYKVNGKAEKMHEKSQFSKENGQWRYLSGETGVK